MKTTMEFNEKLQALRKEKGLTQEELASKLFVSRAAVSKWESGRGYPSIDSLSDIAAFFSVTVDTLISPGEILTIAKKDTRENKRQLCDIIFALVDICAALFLFLPLFADRGEAFVRAVSLLDLNGTALFLKVIYLLVVLISVLLGIVSLSLQKQEITLWVKIKTPISFGVSILCAFLFMISLYPYAALLAFAFLLIKGFVFIKSR